MRFNLFTYIFVVFGLFAHVETAQADCAVTGATGSGGEIVMCTGTDTDGYDGTLFIDDLTIPSGAVVSRASGDTINLSDGNDVVLISGGTVTSNSDPIETEDGDDYVTMTSGSLIGDSDGIRLNDGNDTIIITGGVITGNGDDGVEGDGGNDTIIISGAVITGSDAAIEADSGDDLVEIGDNTTINGMMDGGTDVDTLRFSMTVPPGDLASLQSALSAANPAADSIVINGENYQWVNFESIEDNLRGAQATSVPSLQIWGLLMLMGLVLLVTKTSIRKVR
ncbi:hypothetical protein [Marinicella gelatinilytica]|uniref:hypothetical protein n=1 Tax=Marinicella gelatinilytica TaxID=2996017 RepID=UPI002260B4D6|nr:hypothetical protein [Marinicella gelatinilytica]MCX7544333.1 hypothetical protein [Marinicella gelatinilytica]